MISVVVVVVVFVAGILVVDNRPKAKEVGGGACSHDGGVWPSRQGRTLSFKVIARSTPMALPPRRIPWLRIESAGKLFEGWSQWSVTDDPALEHWQHFCRVGTTKSYALFPPRLLLRPAV